MEQSHNKIHSFKTEFARGVKEFKGDTPEESCKNTRVKSNFTHRLFIDSHDLKSGIQFIGSTGSGKTNAIAQSIFKPVISENLGFLYLDARGDASLADDVAKLCHEYGREDDFVYLDFGAYLSDTVAEQGSVLLNKVVDTNKIVAPVSFFQKLNNYAIDPSVEALATLCQRGE